MSALVLVAYGHTLPYPFEFDDLTSIRDNHALDRIDDLLGVWRYRPIGRAHV